MHVLVGLLASFAIAFIVCKIIKRSFVLVWLSTGVTMLTILLSALTVIVIVSEGVTDETMFVLLGAVMSWIASGLLWKGTLEC